MEDVCGPYPGINHDARVANLSLLEERLAEFCSLPNATNDGMVDYAIYGDPAYTLSRFIVKPYDRIGATEEELYHNTVMSTGRVSVENAIGQVTSTFSALDFTRLERPSVGNISVKYLVAVILRNLMTCIRGENQISSFFNYSPPTLHQFLAARTRNPPQLVNLGIFPHDDD
jgi:nuclease HARBI1